MHLDQKGPEKSEGSLFEIFTTFIKFIDYFNHEKSSEGNISYWVRGHSKDIISFEFGCYLLSNIDYWLFAHNNQHRKEIMAYLTGNFLKSFSEPLSMSFVELNSILNTRLPLYGQLKKETHFGTDKFDREDYERYYKTVSDIFLNSKDKDKIIEFNYINEIPPILNIDDTHKLIMRINSFEIYMLKSFYEQIETVNFGSQRNSE